ncbi:MAG: putative ATP-dependent DNA helicase [Prokaryotic dsDNA virus sp.]|nr:MAG: putative ATP-dependent DNA helicase [Prokaryotic dsDNA virus sp.]|tara:strand:- start:11403 stop:12965 length:1563 start_codon:yes stop_codon:yes gene_type:complete
MMNFTPPKEICLRDYQSTAIEGLRDGIRGGKKRLILCAGTGAGKTLTAAHLLKEASHKGRYALFIVDRVALVDQTSAVFDEYGIPHGIVQGINDRWLPNENVQICSAQTLAKRRLPRDPDLIVVDECHAQYKATLEYMAKYPDAVKVGLTATPFTKGMGEHWDDVVNVIPTRQLIDAGHLIEPKIYVAKSPDDADLGVKSNGEFSDSSATAAGIQIIGDVVSEWVGKTNEHFGGPAKTIVFSPTVEHGRELCAAFKEAGFNFQQISYMDKDDSERAEKIAEFRKPDSSIMGLVSCGVLTKGFDVPDVKVGISCKPYRKSLSSHMQEIGRIMRTHPDKSLALWLCHSGNIERFALDTFDVWENGAGELDKSTKKDSQPRERNEVEREKVVCPECSGAMRGPTCTVCGFEKPARSGIQVVEGELQEFSMKSAMQPRAGLRAECLNEPRRVWEAALAYTSERTRKGEQHARKWAYGIFRGVYPTSKLPFGWFDMSIPPAGAVRQDAYSLVDRETRRFRRRGAA